jgi:hypothetical protein
LADELQDAGAGLAGLSGCRTSLRELSLRGEAAGPDVTAAIAGVRNFHKLIKASSVHGQLVGMTSLGGRHLELSMLYNIKMHAPSGQHRQVSGATPAVLQA